MIWAPFPAFATRFRRGGELKQAAQTYRYADSVKIMKDEAIRGAVSGF
jgi:hypothetical protein